MIVSSMILVACGGGTTTTTTSPGGDGGSTGATATTGVAGQTGTQPTVATGGGDTQPKAAGTTAEATEGGATGGVPANLGELSGNIEIDGSSTVLPISEAAAGEFKKAGAQNVNVTVASSGTGGGFERFCNGEIEISDASRPIKPEEIQTCQQNNVEFIELPVALDGLAVVTDPDTQFLECLTVDELKKIWEPDAEGNITTWNQVRPSFPEEEIALFGPGTQSGTFDYFTDEVVGEEGASRADYTASEDDNVLVQGVSGTQNSLGYFGYAYFEENREQLKLLGVNDGKSGCVQPTAETVNNGTYPLSRPLFIYVSKEAAQRPEVKAFVNFYLSREFTPTVNEVGYVAMTDPQYQAIQQRFQRNETGTELAEGKEFSLDLYTGKSR